MMVRTKNAIQLGKTWNTGRPSAQAMFPTHSTTEPASISQVKAAACRRTMARLIPMSAALDAPAAHGAQGSPVNIATAATAPATGARKAQPRASATVRSREITTPKTPSTISGPCSTA